VARKIFEVNYQFRKLHNEKLVIIVGYEILWWPGYVARAEKERNVCNILVGKPFGEMSHVP
jgi:hypothetical protein